MNRIEQLFTCLALVFAAVVVIVASSALYLSITDSIDSRKPNYTRIGYFDNRPLILDLERVKHTISEVKSAILK